MSLVADILQACAAAPQPWHPGEFVRGRSEPIEDVTFCLNVLCQAELLKLVVHEDQSAGFHLTRRGAELASDPQAIERFVAAEGLNFSTTSSTQGQVIRQTLCEPVRPRMNCVLFALNFLVFGIGLFLAWRDGIFGDYIWPMPPQNPAAFEKVLFQIGLLTGRDLLKGEWWRLLTCGFVHIGVLHLAMNMYALRVLGTDCEWLWGTWRSLLIYLLAILGGSCAAMLQPLAEVGGRPVALGGASGALCGLLAAVAAWTVLNRRYLPRRMVNRQMRAIYINVFMITLISLIPRVSWKAHLGGAVIGLVAALLLHLHRFGGPVTRRLAILGLVAVPVGCIGGLHWAMEHEADWQQLRALHQVGGGPRRADLQFLARQVQLDGEIRTSERELGPFLNEAPPRDADRVARTVEQLQDLIARCNQVADTARLPGQSNQKIREFARAGNFYFERQALLLIRMRTVLRDNRPWKLSPDERELLSKGRQRWLETGAALDEDD